MADREATEYAKFATTPYTLGDSQKVRSNPIVHYDKVVGVSGDAVDDKLYIAKLPSTALILPSSTIYHEAAGTSVTVNLGDATTTDALASLVDVSSAGSFSVFENVAVDDYAKPLWELLGMSEDPKSDIDVYFTIKGAALGADTSFVCEIFYT